MVELKLKHYFNASTIYYLCANFPVVRLTHLLKITSNIQNFYHQHRDTNNKILTD